MEHVLSSSGFMPHGHCYLWKPALVWTMLVSDLLIGFAYIAISFLLYGLVNKIRLPFSGMFLAFGAFIGFCGATHFMEVWTLWNPDYWVAAGVKAVTAIASVATGALLIPVRPKITEMAVAARLSQERKIKLENAHKELEVLYEKVKESDQIKTQFFANISHELRTPLALILGPSEQLLAEPSRLTENQLQKIEVINRNSKTLLKLVNDLLDISKLEAGRLQPQYASLNLGSLLRVTAAHFETAMQTKNIFFSVDIPENLEAQLDPEKMQRVFMNLLSNAVKFTPTGGRIRISLAKDKDQAVIRISDTGPGISDTLKIKVFDRFVQGEGGVSRQFGGTGLGLSIVRDFIQMHRGSVRVQDSEIGGATFEVRIPIFAPPGTAVKSKVELLEHSDVVVEGTLEELKLYTSSNEIHSRTGKSLVLVCEDNPDMRRHISESLIEDFDIVTAADGREGLAKAIALKPDLIISDIMMPHIGGDELLREIRKNSETAATPLLFISARADDALRIGLLRNGANDYVVKPFSAEELKVRAANLVTLKRTRDLLSQSLNSKSQDVIRLAQEVTAKNREAEIARDAAEAAREQAEQANQTKGNFLNLVSHELKTP